ncbi:MAG TPA: HD domain-containing protein, partial [Longimicrobiales bacterium]|nr:HD domain-containing protein [Longimicrobiales bacterium]
MPGVEPARELRDFLTAETGRLIERHRLGLGGREIARGRTALVDTVVARASRMVAEALGLEARADLAAGAVLATGEYGRGELSPCSGLELLLLHEGRPTAAWRTFAEDLATLLADTGLELRHRLAPVDACVDLARREVEERNAMIDTRLVAGSEELFRRFSAAMLAGVYANEEANASFFEAMRAHTASRRERFGHAVGMLEPHLVHGTGGLGDLHAMRAVALARHGLRHADELLHDGLLARGEHRRVVRAADTILRVRHELHLLTGKSTDVLTLDLQPAVAEALGHEGRAGASASEALMLDLYRRMGELHRVCESFLLRAGLSVAGRHPATGPVAVKAVGPGDRYRLRDGILHADPWALERERRPLRLFEIFRTAQLHGARIAGDLAEAVRVRLRLVDRALRAAPEASAAFLDILRHPGGCAPTLRAMHEAGLLTRYVPELRRITLRVQHDHYHRYTIDEHTLQVIAGIDRLADGAADDERAPLRAALARVRDRGVLVLAALLHDVGKGTGSGSDHATRGAAVARRVCRRLGLGPDAADDVVFLVQKHLVMARTSQRRDLTDEAVLEGFADTVGTEDRLDMLYVLTYADLAGVAPDSWNEWKGAVLHELHRAAFERLGSGRGRPQTSETHAALEERVLRELSPEFLRSDVDDFLAGLPARYARVVPPEIIARHFEMWRALGEGPLLHWRSPRGGPYSVLSVCARDAPGLLARVAGGLTAAGLDVLSLDVFTHADGVALDV